MGVSALSDICQSLLQAGMDQDMPAAILQKGTTAGQKRIVATVSTLEEEVKKQGIETPAIIVVGKVCALAKEFAWHEKLPLSGYKVMVTRPRDLISSMASRLRLLGAEVLELPAIRTEPLKDQTLLYKALKAVDTYQWVVFTSPTGVRIFFEELLKSATDIRKLAHLKVAAIGKGTKKALEEKGFFADYMPEVFDGEALGRGLCELCEGTEKILLPSFTSNSSLYKMPGILVDDISIYDTFYETRDLLDRKKEFETGSIDCAVFTSASTVRGFKEATPGLDYTKVRAACIGRQTQAEAAALGMETYMAREASIDSLLTLVIQLKGKTARK